MISQVADGDGWGTTIVLTNTGVAQTAQLTFTRASVRGDTAWTPPFETVNLSAISLAAGAALFLHARHCADSRMAGGVRPPTG
jgi:hypothetical protein